ncbi:hypothetical protein [Nocardia wallacei]|uniref:hypothetical protein n=1 Tax=Nocardia wallacei TaxID=480035 RepID=UPI0024563654|nr:hypothetical protein [Nocardia wallacei]
MTGAVLAVAAVVICGVVIGVVVWQDIREPRDNPPIVQTARRALVSEHPRQRQWPDDPPTVAVVPYTHAAPPRPFDVPGARRAMQQHLECTPDTCPRKREAIRALVAARVMHPSGRKRRRLRSSRSVG